MDVVWAIWVSDVVLVGYGMRLERKCTELRVLLQKLAHGHTEVHRLLLLPDLVVALLAVGLGYIGTCWIRCGVVTIR